MTAPNTTVNTPVDTTPAFDEMNEMERTIQSTLHESKSIIADEEPITDRPRNAAGQFVAVAEGETKPAGEWNTVPDATAAPTDGTVADGTPTAEAEPVTIPEGYVAPATLPPEKVQGFKVFDTDGEVVPPDLKFEVNFRGPNGEAQPRTLDLPKLVNYARMGVYNHEREQQSTAIRGENQTLYQRTSEQEQQIQQLRRDREQLLSNPDYLMKQLADFEQQNTPEARAERDRQQLQTDRMRFAFDQAAQVNTSFLDTQVAPALETIAQSLPTVTMDDLSGRLAMALAPYKVQTPFGTIINPQALEHVKSLILSDLLPWAQQVHADREERQTTRQAPPKPKAAATPDPKLEAAQARAQKARRVAVAAIKPAGGNGQLHGQPADQKPLKSGRDIEDAVITRSLASIGRTG